MSRKYYGLEDAVESLRNCNIAPINEPLGYEFAYDCDHDTVVGGVHFAKNEVKLNTSDGHIIRVYGYVNTLQEITAERILKEIEEELAYYQED